MEITVTDAGSPRKPTRRTLTLRLTDDNALYTYFVGAVIDNGKPEAWLYDRSTNRRTVVREGEEFRIADVTGKVDPDHGGCDGRQSGEQSTVWNWARICGAGRRRNGRFVP